MYVNKFVNLKIPNLQQNSVSENLHKLQKNTHTKITLKYSKNTIALRILEHLPNKNTTFAAKT